MKLGRPEDASCRSATPGKAGPQLVERLLDAVRDLERVRARELLDDEQQARVAVVDDRVADQRLVVLDHVGDVAERSAAARSPSIGDLAPGRSGVVIGEDVLDRRAAGSACR